MTVKKNAPVRAGTEPCRVAVVHDTSVGEDFIGPQTADKLPQSHEGIP